MKVKECKRPGQNRRGKTEVQKHLKFHNDCRRRHQLSEGLRNLLLDFLCILMNQINKSTTSVVTVTISSAKAKKYKNTN